ncbi:MAG: uroporphyrinogen decarboxylase family protein [bacterium]|nr:uroporphyrinogen decarboxylase family protein [bacterium]
MEMTLRERYSKMMNFERPDKPFIWTFPIRKATMDEWLKQGHPEGVRTEELLGYDWFDSLPLVTGHWPRFERVIVEEKDGHITYYDEEGALKIEGVDAQGSGFVTRKWLKFPVENREDFIRMKEERYNPEDMNRRVEGFDEAIARSHTGNRPFMVVIQGFYWTMRQWLGFENLSMAFYDMPDLIDEMMDFILEYNVRLLEKHLKGARVDCLMINEDMAYKTAMMVSPSIFREKFIPRYRELANAARENGVDLVFTDSDGHVKELVPLLAEAGVEGLSPVEIASEQRLEDLADANPGFRFLGGLDKRVLSRTKADVEREVVSKAKYMYNRGGWIPAVDHAVPADAKLENFKYMIELVKECW